MTASPSVVWVLPDKMGGVFNLVSSVIAHADGGRFVHRMVLTDALLEVDTRSPSEVLAGSRTRVEHRLPVENLYAVLRRLRDALPEGEGVLVANDWLELAAATAFDTRRTVVQIVHGDYDYYYDLATRHERVIDVFVTCAQRIAEQLRLRLPHRADDIVHLATGVSVPGRSRPPAHAGPLRLVFVGRIVSGKGVFDLPRIDAALARSGIAVTWTIIGSGPDESQLRRQWSGDRVRHTGALSHAEVLTLYPEHDMLVLPSRAEGLPLTMLEAMGAGVVPLMSDLPNGIRDAIVPGESGWLAAVGDSEAFAAAIATMHADRSRLDAMSMASRRRVAASFDIVQMASGYDRLFARHAELRRPRARALPMPYGSRLDRQWMPNAAVTAVRTAVRRATGKPC